MCALPKIPSTPFFFMCALPQARNYMARKEAERERRQLFDDALSKFKKGTIEEVRCCWRLHCVLLGWRRECWADCWEEQGGSGAACNPAAPAPTLCHLTPPLPNKPCPAC